MTTARRIAGLVVLLGAAVFGVAVVTGWWDDGRRSPELSEFDWRRRVDALVSRSRQPAASVPAALDAEPEVAALPVAPRPTRRPRPPVDATLRQQQQEAFAAPQPKSIEALQPFRETTSIESRGSDDRRGTATLVNLNPTVNTWYVLTLSWPGDEARQYHLVNARPDLQDLLLDPEFPAGVSLADTGGLRRCDLWSADEALVKASGSSRPYERLCNGEVILRLRTAGRKTSIEKVTDFLRTRVWFGESVTVFVRETFFEDAFANTAELADGGAASRTARNGPVAASLAPSVGDQSLTPRELGITLEGTTGGKVAPGEWYPVRGMPGVFASLAWPRLVAPDILQSDRDVVGALDEVEGVALAYLIAFDLDRFDVAFEMGTDHPRVGWSDRVPAETRAPGLPGPDGIDTIAPLVPTGIIGPADADRVAATFTGGFKRTHGGFKSGDLASRNNGSHYGFIEQGVVLSKLQPGLSTLLVLADGTVEMKTWTDEDQAMQERVRFARQNGVPILERDATTGAGVPGSLVARWGAGNWSGAQDGRFRSLRAGACMQEGATGRFLIYGYFSTATPSAMARVFQAYQCSYAMHLDMNALEHTYLALYRVQGDQLVVEHLVRGMDVLDKTEDDRLLPRFLGYADNRDFFYLSWRRPQGEAP